MLLIQCNLSEFITHKFFIKLTQLFLSKMQLFYLLNPVFALRVRKLVVKKILKKTHLFGKFFIFLIFRRHSGHGQQRCIGLFSSFIPFVRIVFVEPWRIAVIVHAGKEKEEKWNDKTNIYEPI